MPDVALRRGAPAVRPPARFAAALLPTVLLGARHRDHATAPGNDAGVYALQSANGQPLPMPLAQGEDFASYVAGGSVELRADGRYAFTLTFRITVGGRSEPRSVQDGGSYTVNGAAVTLRSDDGSATVATIIGGRITSIVPLAEDGVLAFVFQR